MEEEFDSIINNLESIGFECYMICYNYLEQDEELKDHHNEISKFVKLYVNKRFAHKQIRHDISMKVEDINPKFKNYSSTIIDMSKVPMFDKQCEYVLKINKLTNSYRIDNFDDKILNICVITRKSFTGGIYFWKSKKEDDIDIYKYMEELYSDPIILLNFVD